MGNWVSITQSTEIQRERMKEREREKEGGDRKRDR